MLRIQRSRRNTKSVATRLARVLFAALCVSLAHAAGASAQPLADRVPADAMIYIGWSGSENMGAGYDNSHLKAFLDHSNVRQIVTEVIPQLMEKAAASDPSAAAPMQILSTIGPVIWKHPTAIYFGGLEFDGNGPPKIKLAILVDAGKDAGTLVDTIQGLLVAVPPQANAQVTNYNGLVAITLGRTDAFDALLGGKANQPGAVAAASLASRKEFKEDMAGMNPSPVLAAYLDIEGLVKLTDGLVNLSQNPDVMKPWPVIKERMGLKNIRTLAFASGLDGRDWSSQAFVSAIGGQATASKALSDDILKTIPQDATIAMAGEQSLSEMFDQTREAAASGGPRDKQEFDRNIQQMNAALGLDLQKDVLQAFGDEWAAYSSPTVGGNGFLGFILVNHLADAVKADKSLTWLEQWGNRVISQQMQKEREKMKIAFEQTKVDDFTLHYLSVPIVEPAWTIKDGNFYAGLYPQIVASAAQQKSPDKSILDNEDFIALRKRLGGENASSFSFLDLPRTIPNGYQMLLAITQLLNGAANVYGINTPAMVLPTLDQFRATLGPAGSFSWTDARGWHLKSVAPFPGSQMLPGSQMDVAVVGTSALMVSILLPSLNKAREMGNRVKCAANLRQIGVGCSLYANENQNRFPKNLGQLLTDENLPVQVFVCPSGDTAIPLEIYAKPEKQAEWVNAHSDYVYLGAGKNGSMPPNDILAYEKLEDHKVGMNILFGDGHVEWVMRDQAETLITKQTGKQEP